MATMRISSLEENVGMKMRINMIWCWEWDGQYNMRDETHLSEMNGMYGWGSYSHLSSTQQ